jgi:hypothetical protein
MKMFPASVNEYYPNPEKWLSTQMLCSGMDVKEHKLNFDENRLVMSFQLNKKKMNVGGFCDHESWVNMTDPRTYKYNADETQSDDIIETEKQAFFKNADKFDPHNFGHHIVHIFKEY